MADPAPYTVSYSFSGWQAVNPSRPLPAASLDNELANVAASIGGLVSSVTSIRRSDGALQNGVVTYDSLTDDLKATISGSTEGITSSDIDPAAFAAQAEAEAGVASDKLMTPLRTAQAVAAQRAFASTVQAQAGTDTATILSPALGRTLVDALRPLATQAEAEGGTNNAAYMTALRVVQLLAALRPSFTGSGSLTWGAIAAGASATQDVTVTGAAVGDRVVLGLPNSLAAGLIVNAWVQAANTVRFRITNITAGALTPNSGATTTYSATALRF